MRDVSPESWYSRDLFDLVQYIIVCATFHQKIGDYATILIYSKLDRPESKFYRNRIFTGTGFDQKYRNRI